MCSWPFDAKFSTTLLFFTEFRKTSPMEDEEAIMSSYRLHATLVTEPKWDRRIMGNYLFCPFMSQYLTKLSAPPAAIYFEFDEKAQLLTEIVLVGSNGTSKATWSGFSVDTMTIRPSLLQLAKALSVLTYVDYSYGSRRHSWYCLYEVRSWLWELGCPNCECKWFCCTIRG